MGKKRLSFKVGFLSTPFLLMLPDVQELRVSNEDRYFVLWKSMRPALVLLDQ